MSILNNLKIGVKMIGGFVLAASFLVAGTLAGYLSTKVIHDQMARQFVVRTQPSNLITSIAISVSKIQQDLRNYQQNPASSPGNPGLIDHENAKIDAAIEQLKTTPIDQGGANKLAQVIAAWSSLKQNFTGQVMADGAGQGQSRQQNNVGAVPGSGADTFLNLLEQWQSENLQQADQEDKTGAKTFETLAAGMITAGFFGIMIALFIGYLLSRNISDPLKIISTGMQEFSVGMLDRSTSQLIQEKVAHRLDELGQVGKNLVRVEEYIQSMIDVANKLANGNLTVSISPRSDRDQLSLAFGQMTTSLTRLIQRVDENSQQIAGASQQLHSAAEQTSQAASQINVTIQQVAQGINQQSSDLNHTVSVVEKNTTTIGRVARGAKEQEQAVAETNQIVSQINTAIQEMLRDVNIVTSVSAASAKQASDGSATVEKVVTSMDEIRNLVGKLEEKISAMDSRSDEIGSIVEAIEDIASKTNILAINATIEAAHAETQVKRLTEDILNQMMVSQCNMVSRLLTQNSGSLSHQFWLELGNSTALDTILATDSDGVVTISSEPKLIGWRFDDSPKAQTYPFRGLIHQKDGVFCQESQARAMDNQVFKYVGVSRVDEPGIIQVGYNLNSLKKFEVKLNGFAVVANEVYQLAEQSREATREIRKLIKGIQTSVKEANVAMQTSSKEVSAGKERVDTAGQALAQILSSVMEVNQQALNAANAAKHMQEFSHTLTTTMDTVARVVVQNTTSATEMDKSYGFIARTMENIASLSQENSAATQEVSAASGEMRSQIEEVSHSARALASMAAGLQQAISQFQISI